MINPKMVGMLAAAFVAGSFFASPELRAYASTIANDVICSGCVGTSDLAGNAVTSAKIKDGEVKTADIGGSAVTNAKISNGAVNSAKVADNSMTAADIATDAVGAAELQGVTKLSFARCNTDAFAGFSAGEGSSFSVQCIIAGVDQNDNVIATLTSTGTSVCYAVLGTQAGTGLVNVRIMNMCSANIQFGAGHTISIIVYDK